jgi:hypothetical protein
VDRVLYDPDVSSIPPIIRKASFPRYGWRIVLLAPRVPAFLHIQEPEMMWYQCATAGSIQVTSKNIPWPGRKIFPGQAVARP